MPILVMFDFKFAWLQKIMRIAIRTALLVFAFLSSNAFAALLEFDDFTYDSAQQLDWLDLTATLGQTGANAETLNPGWRLATNSEVEGMFAQAFPNYVANSYFGDDTASTNSGAPNYLELVDEAVEFRELFGGSERTDFVSIINLETGEISPGLRITANARGFYLDEDSEWRIMGVSTTTGVLDSTIVSQGAQIYGLDAGKDHPPLLTSIIGSSDVGVFLVRPTVIPVPAAVWMFGSALMVLGFARR